MELIRALVLMALITLVPFGLTAVGMHVVDTIAHRKRMQRVLDLADARLEYYRRVHSEYR